MLKTNVTSTVSNSKGVQGLTIANMEKIWKKFEKKRILKWQTYLSSGKFEEDAVKAYKQKHETMA